MTENPTDRRARIAAAFGRAQSYDEAATVQRAAAVQMARWLGRGGLPANPLILELGCGTGFLTRSLSEALGPARWIVSDISPEMVERARTSVGIAADYRVIDGEAVDPALGRFDLIASNMTFQWLGDLPGAVARLSAMLEPKGVLAFSTMAAGSFAEWNAALAAEGLASGTPAYPDRRALLALAPPGMRAEVPMVDYPETQTDARAFLRQLKEIGAATPASGYRPLSGPALRRAMARFDAGPRVVTYRIGFCLFRRLSD